MKYRGSCHCGQVAFEAEGEISEVLACNCSICQRKGSLLWFIPRAQLKLFNKPEEMSTYTFSKHVIKHHFCPVCGMQPFGEGTGPDGSAVAAINVRCLEGVEPESFKVKHFNGRAICTGRQRAMVPAAVTAPLRLSLPYLLHGGMLRLAHVNLS